MNNVMFFDFDGVLAGYMDWRSYDNPIYPLSAIENNRIKYINSILKQKKKFAYFFPISSWSNEFKDKSFMQEWFNKMGLDCFNVPTTDINHFTKHDRGKFVKDYVTDNNIKNYIVLDDECSEQYEENDVNYIQTSMYDGITWEQMQRLIKIIEEW